VGFLSFTAWPFALAGAVCALGPILIHLLNRRRYKVVAWGAMDFLREAIQRNRRILQIRDLLLLLLRTAAVLLFGLALAQPFFATREEAFNSRQPLHAVIVVDNSLSMAYAALDGDLLAKAKERARELIDKLPTGSKITVLPACGGRDYALEPFDTKEDAREALDRIDIVDRSASLPRVASEAQRACEAAPELAPRIVFIGDQQQFNWRDLRGSDLVEKLPAMQLVDVAPDEWENSWIADLRVQDGLADIETPATVIVEIEHRGPAPREDVQVTLAVGETILGQKTITLEPGLGAKEVDFEVVFSSLPQLPEPERPLFVPLRATLAPDRLTADDERVLAVPVVGSLPVVFVDQFGAEGEDVLRGRIGETRPLRRLLAPRTSHRDAPRQLIQVRHVTLAELSEELLADARLVVIAGIADPAGQVPLLREYVEQGGRLVIAAGASFDPAAWNREAWLDGAGILPLPLSAEPLGEVPEAASDALDVFQLSFESLAGEDYFRLAGVGEAELRDLFAEPFFFKAVAIEEGRDVLDRLQAADLTRLEESARGTDTLAARRAELASRRDRGSQSSAELAQLAADEQSLRSKSPQWLTWSGPTAAILDAESIAATSTAAAERQRPLEEQALAQQPRVLARFEREGQPPFLVSRSVGRGEVIFAASGLASSWSTLGSTHAIVAFDRILRSQLERTLPQRNLSPRERFSLPLPVDEPHLTVSLARPGQSAAEEPLDIGYLGDSLATSPQRGVTLTNLLSRGVYRVVASRGSAESGTEPTTTTLWEVPLAIGGEADESDLTPLRREDREAIAASGQLRWIGPADEIGLTGTAIHAQTSWWWLALLVLTVLLGEMAILAWPSIRPQEAAAP
jgi:hypothetical protein